MNAYCFLLNLLFLARLLATDVNTLTAYSLTVPLKQHPLPISISSLILHSSITKISLKMGHLTATAPNFPYPRGITAYIHNTTQLSNTLLSQIKSLLLISQDARFQVNVPSSSIIISDPNDRLCTEHVQHLLRYFFPCRNFASLGLNKLINPAKLLQRYLAFELQWRVSDEQIIFKIYFPADKEARQVRNRYTACGQVSIQQVNRGSDPLFQNRVKYEGRMMNQWYNPQKSISHIFQTTKIGPNTTIKLVTTLPYGFIYQNFTIYPHNQHIKLSIYQSSHNKFLVFQFPLLRLSVKQHILQVYFRASLPPFQVFQTIAGGGEQLMNVAIFQSNTTSYQLYSPIVSQRLLQPDFSIPFQTITFTVGIVGYLWINLWRIHTFSSKTLRPQKTE